MNDASDRRVHQTCKQKHNMILVVEVEPPVGRVCNYYTDFSFCLYRDDVYAKLK